jgi:hypothetical protein
MPLQYPERHPMQSLCVPDSFPVFEPPGIELFLWTYQLYRQIGSDEVVYQPEHPPTNMSIQNFLKCFEHKGHETDGSQGLRLGQWFPRFRYKNHPGVFPTHRNIT